VASRRCPAVGVESRKPSRASVRFRATCSLLEAAKGHRLDGVISVATALGLRIGEALGLRWADVDFDAEAAIAQPGAITYPQNLLASTPTM